MDRQDSSNNGETLNGERGPLVFLLFFLFLLFFIYLSLFMQGNKK
jgi:hypothetical protein